MLLNIIDNFNTLPWTILESWWTKIHLILAPWKTAVTFNLLLTIYCWFTVFSWWGHPSDSNPTCTSVIHASTDKVIESRGKYLFTGYIMVAYANDLFLQTLEILPLLKFPPVSGYIYQFRRRIYSYWPPVWFSLAYYSLSWFTLSRRRFI